MGAVEEGYSCRKNWDRSVSPPEVRECASPDSIMNSRRGAPLVALHRAVTAALSLGRYRGHTGPHAGAQLSRDYTHLYRAFRPPVTPEAPNLPRLYRTAPLSISPHRDNQIYRTFTVQSHTSPLPHRTLQRLYPNRYHFVLAEIVGLTANLPHRAAPILYRPL